MKRIEEMNAVELLNVVNKLNAINPENKSELAAMEGMDKRIEARAVVLGKEAGDKENDEELIDLMTKVLLNVIGLDSYDDIDETLGTKVLTDMIEKLHHTTPESTLEAKVHNEFMTALVDAAEASLTNDYYNKRFKQIESKLIAIDAIPTACEDCIDRALAFPLIIPRDDVSQDAKEYYYSLLEARKEELKAKRELSEILGAE